MRPGRQVAFYWGAVALLCLALAPLASRASELVESEVIGCPVKSISGLPCPTCGGTRATLALAGLWPGKALALNPGVTVAWLVLVFGGLGALGMALANRPLPALPTRLPVALRFLGIALIAANWLYLYWAGV